MSLVYKTQRNFPAKNCSFIPGCDTLTPFRRLNTRLGCQGIHFWPLVSWGGGLAFYPIRTNSAKSDFQTLTIGVCVCMCLSVHPSMWLWYRYYIDQQILPHYLSIHPSICGSGYKSDQIYFVFKHIQDSSPTVKSNTSSLTDFVQTCVKVTESMCMCVCDSWD